MNRHKRAVKAPHVGVTSEVGSTLQSEWIKEIQTSHTLEIADLALRFHLTLQPLSATGVGVSPQRTQTSNKPPENTSRGFVRPVTSQRSSSLCMIFFSIAFRSYSVVCFGRKL